MTHLDSDWDTLKCVSHTLSHQLPRTRLLRDLQSSTRKGLRDTSHFSLQLGTTDSSLPGIHPFLWCWLWAPAIQKACGGRLLFVRAGTKVFSW